MLKDKPAMGMVGVRDVGAAKRFYQDKLGLTVTEIGQTDTVQLETATNKFWLYETQFAGTNQATIITWLVGNELPRIVERLKGKGITFEHYDLPGAKFEGDIHAFGDMRVAWFKDPDGNILSLISG